MAGNESTSKDTTPIQFFGACDRRGQKMFNPETGELADITSNYPAWMMKTHLDQLKEEIADDERRYNDPILREQNASLVNRKIAEIDKKKKRYREILESKPKLKAKDKELLNALRKDLAKEIRDNMFSRSDMLKGLANPHEELARQKEPGINIENKYAPILKEMNLKHTDKKFKKMSRVDAERAFRIASNCLGEDDNVEKLRRDVPKGAYHPERSLDQIFRDEGI